MSADDRTADLLFLHQAITSSLPREEILEKILGDLIRLLKADRGFILLVSALVPHLCKRTVVFINPRAAGMDQLVVVHGLDHTRQSVRGLGYQLDPALLCAAMQGRTINTSVPFTSGEVRASLAVPLVSGGNTLGALYLDDPRRRLFEATDVQLAQVASTVLSLLLEEVHLERILNQQRFLQELTQDLSSVETEEEIAKWILPRLVARLGFDRTALLLVAPDAQHLILSHARGQGFADVPPALMRQRRRGGRFAIPLLPEEAILRRLRTPFQTFLLTEIRNAGAAALEALADGTRVRIQSRPLVALLRYLRCSSCVVAPCAVQDTLLGVLVVERRRGPTEQDQRYLRFVAARSSASMGPSLPPPTPT